MVADTCTEISMPATLEKEGMIRKIWIVRDKDGSWFISYDDKYATKQKIIFQEN